MPSPPWHDLPFLSANPADQPDLCALRAVRWLLHHGVGLRPEGSGFKAFDVETGLGIYSTDLDRCIYEACLALSAARDARRKPH